MDEGPKTLPDNLNEGTFENGRWAVSVITRVINHPPLCI